MKRQVYSYIVNHNLINLEQRYDVQPRIVYFDYNNNVLSKPNMIIHIDLHRSTITQNRTCVRRHIQVTVIEIEYVSCQVDYSSLQISWILHLVLCYVFPMARHYVKKIIQKTKKKFEKSNGLPWLSLWNLCKGKLAFPHPHTEGKETLLVSTQ